MKCLSEKQTGKTLIRLLLQKQMKKQSDLVCPVCLGFYGSQLLFETLEHLLYYISTVSGD